MNSEIKDSPQLLPGEWRWVPLKKPKNTLPLIKTFSQKQNPHKWTAKKAQNDNNEELYLLKDLVNPKILLKVFNIKKMYSIYLTAQIRSAATDFRNSNP